MRVTQILFRQHIGWHFQNHWRIQAKRRPIPTAAEKILKEKGVEIEEPNEFLKEKIVRDRVEIVGYQDKPQPLDNTHPNWHDRPLLTYKDNNVLLEGLTQAKILTNTVEIQEGLPAKYQLQSISKEINKRAKKIVFGSHIFDAEQEKLPKIKDPARPAFNFPRVYGVTQNRVYTLLISKLLNLIEVSSERQVVRNRYLADKVLFSYPFERNGDLIKFEQLGDNVLLSRNPLSPITAENTKGFELPDIFPIAPTSTLTPENIYSLDNIYAIKKSSPISHPHTIFFNFNREKVKNLFEEEVSESQIFGRTLLKTFTAAASYAKEQYGETVKDLPSPVTLQAVQTDGKRFYFGVLQLNTLNPENSEVKNIWYQIPGIDLFNTCAYQVGKPVLEGYNKQVLQHLFSFYNNV